MGGGIGGLAAAVALRRTGCHVEVLERAEEISAVGAGIILQANAIVALQMIGVAEDVVAAAVPVTSARVSSWSGRVLSELDSSDLPVPGVGLHRTDLHRLLSKHAGVESVRTGARVVSYELVGDRVVVVLESGEEITGDLLVGADGIHSAVRAQHLADGPPRYAGYTCWRGMTPHPDQFERGRVFEIWGVGKRFGGLHVDERLYWFAPANAAPNGRDARRSPCRS